MNKKFFPLILISFFVALIPIWTGTYLPFTDLPQHAAQLTIFSQYNNPSFLFHQLFDLQWLTPYSLFFLVGRLLTVIFTPLVAIKILISITIVCFPLSFYALLSQTKGPKELFLLGLPLAYGVNLMLCRRII